MNSVVSKNKLKFDLKPKISINSLTVKSPNSDKGEIIALDNINLKVKENEFVCIMGPSGCGKKSGWPTLESEDIENILWGTANRLYNLGLAN